ncbi:MAG: MFS transporter [Acidobacteria bacterium]|nr:MAG: MFS transporter [Acidobacteriota bacterium]
MIDVREEIENAEVGSYHRLIAVLIALAVFFDGYDTFSPAYVIHYVMKPWHLPPSQAGLLVSSGLVGFMLGSLAQGEFSDRYGRRVTLLGALWIATVFSLGTALFARSFWTFCGLRVLTGLGLGALLPIGVTYLTEFAPRRTLHTFTTWGWALGWAIGSVAVSLVGVFLTPSLGWQTLYYVASLSVVLAVVCHFVLPESLHFSAMRGRVGDIPATLSRLNPSRAAAYADPGAQFIFAEPGDRAASFALLLSGRYRSTSLAVWAAAFFILFSIFGLASWIPTVMMRRGETFAVSFAFGGLIQIMGFVGALLCGLLAERTGRDRIFLSVWWLGGALSILALALVNDHYLNIFLIAVAGFCIPGGQNILNNFTAASYETEVRGTAVGTMLGVGRLGAILGPFLAGWLQQIYPGSMALFGAISLAVALGACAAMVAPPRHTRAIFGQGKSVCAAIRKDV